LPRFIQGCKSGFDLKSNPDYYKFSGAFFASPPAPLRFGEGGATVWGLREFVGKCALLFVCYPQIPGTLAPFPDSGKGRGWGGLTDSIHPVNHAGHKIPLFGNHSTVVQNNSRDGFIIRVKKTYSFKIR